ncbi:efflux RND transporter permease subunit [Rhodopirellula sp. P2]|uniref:efflux RND transporter permease subunit n=1 Tax=Rhodopirellula sp. P2 TaxID=2127060 RepID=UPI0023687E3B|nr:MMPL family transporter [Rhodopirellula sp. P2]WDQ15451.1 MMPL family transporter [Rhodopirellula sp. P2]
MPLKSLGDQATTYRVRFCIGLLAVCILGPLAARDSTRALSTMYNAPALWLPEDMPVRKQYDDFSKLFQGQDVLMIGWDEATIGSEQVDAAAEALLPLTQATPDRPAHLAGVSSGQRVYDVLTSPPTSFSDRATRARLKGSLIGEDGEQTIVLATFTEQGNLNRQDVLAEVRQIVSDTIGVPEDQIYTAGPPTDGALVDAEAQGSIDRFTLPSVIVGALICVFCLRSIVLTAIIIIVAVIGQGMSLAMVLYSGIEMNAILIVLPPLVFVLTASAGIHLCNYYRDAMCSDPTIDPTAATRQAMQAGILPCWLAATTTIIGLGSLGLVRLVPVSAFGFIAAGSVFGTLLLLLLLLPGAMQWHGKRHRAKHRAALAKARKTENSETEDDPLPVEHWRSQIGHAWEAFAAQFMRYPIIVVTFFTIITAVAASGLPQLTTSVNIPRMFPENSRIRTDYAWFEEHIGPTINAEVVVQFPPASMPDPIDRFRLVRDVDDHLRSTELVGGVFSARSFLPSPPSKKSRSIRSTVLEANIRKQLEDPDSPLQDAGYIAIDDNGNQLWRISFRFPFDEAIDYRTEFQRVQAEVIPILEEAGQGISPQFTGGVPMTTESQDVLLQDLFRSFLAAFGIVAIIMMLLLRSFVGGLVAMFPNLFPTITLFGTMGLLETPLDIGSVMTASVALGIAVDGTIHFLTKFQSQSRKGKARTEASLAALHKCGPAMWQTTAVCAISPLVYGLSDFQPTQRFAFMMFGLLLAALIGDVLLLPALLASPLGRFLTPKMPSAKANSANDSSTTP